MQADGVELYLEIRGVRQRIKGPEATLGRSRNCVVVVRDPAVSRNHALISIGETGATLTDLDSSNGCFVNGRRITKETNLVAGDRITLGETEIKVRLETPSEASGGAGPEGNKVAVFPPRQGPSRSEAMSLGDVMPVGEVLASPSDSWNLTGPVGEKARQRAEKVRASLGKEIPDLWGSDDRGHGPDTAPTESSGEVLDARELLKSFEEVKGEPEPLPTVEALSFRGASPFARLAAAFVDGILVGVVGWLALAVLPTGSIARLIGGFLPLVLWSAVAFLGWTRFGTTPGKKLLGLGVFRVGAAVPGLDPGSALRRLGASILCALPLGLGYLAVPLAKDHRGLHDRFAVTVVRRLEIDPSA